MKIKEFIFDAGLRELFYKGKELENMIRNNDPALENIILDVRDYKKYFCSSGQYKIRLLISIIAMVYLFFFSGVAAALPVLLIKNPSHEIMATFFMLTLVIAACVSFLHVGFTLKGYYYGSVIRNYLNYIVFFSSLFIIFSNKTSNVSSIYFIFIAVCCFVIKITLNSRYYTDFILANMRYRIAIIIDRKEMNKIQGLNKKQLREYSRALKLAKRKKIRDQKRENQSVEK
ncbi:hypothetical protein [Xenorhabdus sp. Sc-CR9]|uniref:hypothetical protein n=1 Tax=Xenorhabdus sp. Sc-CR9 TaxID=2584468 RepID=UPI001F245524|nr:hypothetical protein [Xenorhabdus sp. Sc-CR9]